MWRIEDHMGKIDTLCTEILGYAILYELRHFLGESLISVFQTRGSSIT